MAKTWSCETSEVGLLGEVAGTTLKQATWRYYLLAESARRILPFAMEWLSQDARPARGRIERVKGVLHDTQDAVGDGV